MAYLEYRAAETTRDVMTEQARRGAATYAERLTHQSNRLLATDPN